MDAYEREGTFDVASIALVGGDLSLDFANTVEGRGGSQLRDAIHGGPDLIAWAFRAGALTEEESSRMLSEPDGETDSESVVGRALAVREANYRVFTAIARDRQPDAGDLEALRTSNADAVRHAHLMILDPTVPRAGAVLAWSVADGEAIDVIRWRVAAAAIDLLRSGRLDRLRQCPGGGEEPCNWLFIDTTRAGNRRWCSMADCGGRAKWRRQNARRRERQRIVQVEGKGSDGG